jgi:hypothetical protein
MQDKARYIKDEIKYQGRNPFVKPKMAGVSGKTHARLLFF